MLMNSWISVRSFCGSSSACSLMELYDDANKRPDVVTFEILNTFLNDNCALLVYVVFSIRVCLNDMPRVSPVSSLIYNIGGVVL